MLQTALWPDYTTGVYRAAGSTHLFRGGGQGELPHGTCRVAFTAVASNSTAGAATLLPGAATLTFTIVTEDGSFVSAGYTQEGVTLIAG